MTYTDHDKVSFAHDMSYVDEANEVKSPFLWDEDLRRRLCTKLDAGLFHLYGVTDHKDIRYIYSIFPIIERKEKADYGGGHHFCKLCLACRNTLALENPDPEVQL